MEGELALIGNVIWFVCAGWIFGIGWVLAARSGAHLKVQCCGQGRERDPRCTEVEMGRCG